ncbi:hypothetical protein [Listeria booriae]|uniref:hypothetical protein n=1 Tax=Listeria booriae TaxID=1552123 RepID=UPI001E2A083E|nr:hypothetical protein [Listeria booriae]MCD2207426.1 hypothetical protein [Listeria booriae]
MDIIRCGGDGIPRALLDGLQIHFIAMSHTIRDGVQIYRIIVRDEIHFAIVGSFQGVGLDTKCPCRWIDAGIGIGDHLLVVG